MCIGFSVDFSAHISYHFLAAKGQSSDERIRSSLKAFGTPIIQVSWPILIHTEDIFFNTHLGYSLNFIVVCYLTLDVGKVSKS